MAVVAEQVDSEPGLAKSENTGREVTRLSGDFAALKEGVIKSGLCTACGTCVGVCQFAALRMADVDGEPLPELYAECQDCGVCLETCPGRDIPIPELELASFGDQRSHPQLGRYLEAGHAYAADPVVRREGSSGGLATALLHYALEQGIVDCVLAAGFDPHTPWRAVPALAATGQEVLASAQSKYAAVPVNALLATALEQGHERLAVVGLPCHVHGLRKIQRAGKPGAIARSIRLIVGIFCAGQIYFEGTRHALRELAGIEDLDDIHKLEYRGNAGRSLVVTRRDGQTVEIDRHVYMHHFLQPGYRRDRCMVCLDWSADLADVAVGEYLPGEEGVSVYLARSEMGRQLVRGAESAGFVRVMEKPPEEVLAGITAKTAYELKKHADAFRYSQRRSRGLPVPDFHLEPDFRPEAKLYRILGHHEW